MTPESHDFAVAWLDKAYSDLASAKILIQGPERYLDTGCFHCQQSAEKSLKGWLTAQEVIFPKTHLLESILELCIPINPNFSHFQHHAKTLSPFAIEYRYPGDEFEPSPEQASVALKLAEEVFDFCKQSIGEAHNE